jgi:hypothetical protein
MGLRLAGGKQLLGLGTGGTCGSTCIKQAALISSVAVNIIQHGYNMVGGVPRFAVSSQPGRVAG